MGFTYCSVGQHGITYRKRSVSSLLANRYFTSSNYPLGIGEAHQEMGCPAPPNVMFQYFRVARLSPKVCAVAKARLIPPIGKYLFSCPPDALPIGHMGARFSLILRKFALQCPKMSGKLHENGQVWLNLRTARIDYSSFSCFITA